MINKIILSSKVLLLFLQVVKSSNGECRDVDGRVTAQAMHYVPGPDSCIVCICDNGFPKWCNAILCSPPQDCKSFRVGKSCCELICLDDALNKGDGMTDFGADFGLRLIVSAVAAILSLCLLFFLVHRLRQRKIRGRQNRQFSEDERSLASIGYITGSLGYIPQNYFSSHGGPERHLEFHYEEPPSHLSLWKPSANYFPRGEAPPPYEEAISQGRGDVTLSNTLPAFSHRTIPLNLRTAGTIRLVNPASIRREQTNTSSSNQDLIHSHSSTNIVQTLDPSTVCIVETTNTLRHSLNTRNNNLIRNDSNSLGRSDFSSNSVIRNTVSLPRSSEKQKNPTNIVSLRQNLEKDVDSTPNLGKNLLTETNFNASRDNSTLHYEININSNTCTNEESFYDVLRKNKNMIQKQELNGNAENPCLTVDLCDIARLKPDEIPHPYQIFSNDTENTILRSDVLYQEVIVGSIPCSTRLRGNAVQNDNDNFENIKKSVDEDATSNTSEILPLPVLEETSLTEPENDPSSCDCSSYQCLTNNDDNDDYRSECENCKSGNGSSYYLDEDLEPPETMTLQRVPKESDEFENQEQYYRTSLTLPTHCRKLRSTQPGSGARENWFSSMPESGSSSEEE